MAFCPNCGTQMGTGQFCPNCGAGAGTATGSGQSSAGYTAPSTGFGASGMSDNVASTLCYAGWFITGIIFLVIAPYNRNRTVRFHAWQSIITFIATVIAGEVLSVILFDVLHLWTLGITIMALFRLGVFILWLYLMYMAYNNRRIVLPVITDLANKQA